MMVSPYTLRIALLSTSTAFALGGQVPLPSVISEAAAAFSGLGASKASIVWGRKLAVTVYVNAGTELTGLFVSVTVRLTVFGIDAIVLTIGQFLLGARRSVHARVPLAST